MSRLSIVIPVLGKLKKLEDTLVSVLENRPAHCEIVVVLNEPYDDPYELAGEVNFFEAPSRAGLIDCLNLGIQASLGTIIHTLGCGTEVTPGWSVSALRHFDRQEVAAVTPLVIDRTQSEQSLSAGVGYRPGGAAWRLGFRQPIQSALTSLPEFFGPDPVAGFYRKSALDSLGGFNAEFQNNLAGVDLALSLHFADQQCVFEPNCRVVADRSDLPEGERLGSGSQAERLFWRWASRMGWFRASAGHAGLLCNELFESVVRPTTLLRLLGRAVTSISIPFRGRNEPEPITIDIPRESVIAPPHYKQTLDQNRPMIVGKAS